MSRIVMVVACGRNRVIGNEGGMPWHLPEDMKHFRATTMGHPVVMGRRTWESFGGRPLKGRENIVITRQEAYEAPGATVVRTLDEGLAAAAHAGATMVAGGGQVYEAAMPLADELVVSWVDQEPEGDTYFPEIDPAVWAVTSREPRDGFEIVRYERR